MPLDATDSATIDLLVETSFAIMAEVTRVGAENNMSLTMVRVLGILRDRNSTMAELADFLGLERSTVTGLVDRAEARGLLAREPSAADRRSVTLRLTDAGLQLALSATSEIAARLAPLAARLPLSVDS